MKTNQDNISKQVGRIIKKTLTFKDYVKKIRDYSLAIQEHYNIPIDITMDYLSGKKRLYDATPFMLFAILQTLDPSKLNYYFTDKEIKKFSTLKYEPERINFPIELPAVQIATDQWMCMIDVKLLMLLRDAQLIEYNENTQRTLTRVERSGTQIYKITLNPKAVEGIKNSFLKGTYIPNTITLNMPEDTEYDFKFTKDGPTLVIEHIEHFDILDGYHRYIAMSELYNANPEFDYSMELRIVSFREEKARQFIWQEDQKTKMSKVNSESFNQYKASNIITKRICSGPYGQVIRDKDGVIDPATFANILDHTYLRHKTNLSRLDEVLMSKEIESDFKVLEQDYSIYDNKWSKEFATCVIFALWKQMHDAHEIKEFADFAAKRISKNLSGRDITRLEEALEEFAYVQR